jgi:hypothetical protein
MTAVGIAAVISELVEIDKMGVDRSATPSVSK